MSYAMKREILIKGQCDQCPKNLDCPRMRGENLCFGGKERVVIDCREEDAVASSRQGGTGAAMPTDGS